MEPRIQPATAPFTKDVADLFETRLTGYPPLQLFTTLARDPRLFKKFLAGGLLDKGNLTICQRELVIARTTALCRSEYEWGVHITTFAHQAGFSAEQIYATVWGTAEDTCWSAEDRLLLRLSDALHRDCAIDDALWPDLSVSFTENAILELLMVAGFYRTISYLTNGLRMPLDTPGARFPTSSE